MSFRQAGNIQLSLGDLARVPVQEGLAAEHARELLGHALEHLLDRRRVADEAHGHLQTLRRDVA